MCDFNDSIDCPCHNTGCEYFAKCCSCIGRHAPKGQFPACFFSAEFEPKGRSFELLVEDRGK